MTDGSKSGGVATFQDQEDAVPTVRSIPRLILLTPEMRRSPG